MSDKMADDGETEVPRDTILIRGKPTPWNSVPELVRGKALQHGDKIFATIDGRDISETGVEPFGMLANACWNPSISIPAGLTSDGLPVGLRVTARRHRDDILLRLARIYEQAHPWSYPWAD